MEKYHSKEEAEKMLSDFFRGKYAEELAKNERLKKVILIERAVFIGLLTLAFITIIVS